MITAGAQESLKHKSNRTGPRNVVHSIQGKLK